jgi:hypothetical protein
MAVLQTVLHVECLERPAIILIRGDGDDWRERVADIVPIAWGAITGQVDLRPPGLRAVRPTAAAQPGPGPG